MTIKMSRRWLKMLEIYKLFIPEDSINKVDLSECAKEELYTFESTGKGKINDGGDIFGITEKVNGYALGKRWLNVTVAMWKEQLKKYPYLVEHYYNDPQFPHWWLDQIFKKESKPVCNYIKLFKEEQKNANSSL